MRRLVNEHGLDPAAIEGTGTGGRITREDVLDHIDKTGSRAGRPPRPLRPRRPLLRHPRPPRLRRPRPLRPRPPAPPAAKPAAAPSAPAARAGERDESVRLSKIRQLTGDHMIMSKAVTPHAFSVVEVDYANVDRTRSAIKGEWKASEGFSLTYLPFICRALVDALADFPHLNATVGQKELIVHRYKQYDASKRRQGQLRIAGVRLRRSREARALVRC